MKKLILGLAVIASCLNIHAQSDDPIIMTIGNIPVTRSEFVYSYNKNNSEGVIDKKTVDEYVDLFINYKLKVLAALDAKKDTLSSFKKEYTEYRDQQVRPTLITDADIEKEARSIYDNTKARIGDTLLNVAHILFRVEQNADSTVDEAAKNCADSTYNAIQKGADFEELAKKLSQDPGTAPKGGVLGFIGKGQTIPEFENAAFALKDGEVSKPVKTAFGYHIVKVLGRKGFETYDSLKADIYKFIEARGIREAVAKNKLQELVAQHKGMTEADIMNQRADSLAALDSDMKYLFLEYHDGLLLYEVSNERVWDKASKDEAGLKKFFKANKKKYVFDAPRFKGIAYHCKDMADVAKVKKALKGKKFDKWAELLRATFNADSVLRIRAEKGIFKKGDNALVDKEQFKDSSATPKEVKDFPYDSTYGKMLKAPEDMDDVRGQVVADYQDALEKEWVKELRSKYPVVVNEDILATVKKEK